MLSRMTGAESFDFEGLDAADNSAVDNSFNRKFAHISDPNALMDLRSDFMAERTRANQRIESEGKSLDSANRLYEIETDIQSVNFRLVELGYQPWL
jgi:hypothetical protein